MGRRRSSTEEPVYRKTNIRRIRKWRKRRNVSPYLFLFAIFVLGIVVTIIVYRNG